MFAVYSVCAQGVEVELEQIVLVEVDGGLALPITRLGKMPPFFRGVDTVLSVIAPRPGKSRCGRDQKEYRCKFNNYLHRFIKVFFSLAPLGGRLMNILHQSA